MDRARWSGFGAAVALLLAGWCGLHGLATDTTPTLLQPMTDPAACEPAVASVQQYRAPSQADPLELVVPDRVAADLRRVRPAGWGSEPWLGETCRVQDVVYQDRNRRAYSWTWAPATGHVQAMDAWTQRVSGW